MSPVLLAAVVVALAAICGALAGYVLWRVSNLGGLWALILAPLVGFGAFVAAIVIGYLLMRLKEPVWGG